MWPNVNDFARIVRVDFPALEGELPYQTDNRFIESVGLKPSHLQEVGKAVAFNEDGTIAFQPWQLKISINIPRKYLQKELCKDVKGKFFQKGDFAYVVVGKELVHCNFVKATQFKHHGCGWCELGAQFKRIDNGKCFSHYYPKGRLWISNNHS